MVLPWVSRHPQTTASKVSQEATTTTEQKTEGKDENAASSVILEAKATSSSSKAQVPDPSETTSIPRTLCLQHFTQALNEITPSSSETLGSLSDLRKWNEEFGEGRRNRRRRQVWGKGRFGFVDGQGLIVKDGRVA